MSFFTRSFDDATRAQKGYSDFMEGVRQQNRREAADYMRDSLRPQQVTVPTSATGQIPTTRIIPKKEPKKVSTSTSVVEDTAQGFGGATNIGPQRSPMSGTPTGVGVQPSQSNFAPITPAEQAKWDTTSVRPDTARLVGGLMARDSRVTSAAPDPNVSPARQAVNSMIGKFVTGLGRTKLRFEGFLNPITRVMEPDPQERANMDFQDKAVDWLDSPAGEDYVNQNPDALMHVMSKPNGSVIDLYMMATNAEPPVAADIIKRTAGLQPPSTPTAPVTPAFTQSQLQTAIAEIESSGGKNTGKNPNSTASGIYQVTNPTATGKQDADLVAFGLTPAANNSNAAKNAYAVRRLDALTKYWTQQATNGVISQNDIPLKIAQSWHQGFTAAKQNKPLDAATQKYVVKFQNAFQRALSGSAANVTPPPPPPPQSQQGSPAGVDTSTITGNTGRTRTLKTAPAQPQAGVAPKGESHVRDAMVAEKPRAPATNNWTVEIYNKELRDGQFLHKQALRVAELAYLSGDSEAYFKAVQAADQAGHTIENIAINKAINSFEISSDPRMLMAIANTRNPEKQLVIRPRSDGNFDIEENGRIVKENQKRSEIVSLFRREASQAYNTAIKTAAVERESARQEKKWEAQIEAMKQAWQTNRELAKERISKRYGKFIASPSGNGVFIRDGDSFRFLSEKDFPGIDGGESTTRTVAELVPRENVAMTLGGTKAAAYGED